VTDCFSLNRADTEVKVNQNLAERTILTYNYNMHVVFICDKNCNSPAFNAWNSSKITRAFADHPIMFDVT